jgi:GNAT superfamily N-acetyltransferase
MPNTIHATFEPAVHTVVDASADWFRQVGPAFTCVISAELRAADRAALLDLFARSSPQTRRDRFHHALSVFPQQYLDEILEGRQLALVARDICQPDSQGQVIGLASAAPMSESTAEVAVWVDDAWQRRGVGNLLLRGLLRMLADGGFAEAVGIVEPTNTVARRMMERIAPDATTRREDGLLVITVPIRQRSAA